MTSLRKSIFDIAKRRALFLGAKKAVIYHWHEGDLGSSYVFDINADGRSNFARYLSDTPRIPVYLMLDVFEEEYRRETIPHTYGADRNAIITRKQARLFRDNRYTYFRVQDRELSGRRDDNVLLSAITNSELVSPWVELLDKHKVPLTGIYSLPILSGFLLDSLPDVSNNALLVTLEDVGGLRQTFFKDREFRISRLVQMPRYGTAPYLPFIDEEVEKISRYLLSLRLITIDQTLDIYFLLAGELLHEAGKQSRVAGTIRNHFIDINEIAEKNGASFRTSLPFSDQLYVFKLLQQKPANQYGSSTDTRYFTLKNIRYAMLAAILCISLCGAIWSGFNFVDGLIFKQNSTSAIQKSQHYTSRYEIAKERLPKTPVDANDLKVAVELVDKLDQHKTSPIEIVKVVSRALDEYQDVRLEQVHWIASEDPNANLDMRTGEVSRQEYSQPDSGNMSDKYLFYQIAMMEGSIDPFDGNFRLAIDRINRFVEKIRSGENVFDVRIMTLPLDISSDASLQGNTTTSSREAKFSIKVTLGIIRET